MKKIIALCILLAMALGLAGCATLKTADGGETTVENEARKSQAEKISQIVALISTGKLKLSSEMTVCPADPTMPMTNVKVQVVQAADPQIMMALIKLCDMSNYESPATIADVLIAGFGSLERVALKGIDVLPWAWGFSALSDALNQRGYSVTTGDNGSVVIASTGTRSTRIGGDNNTGPASGSDRLKDNSVEVAE